MHQFDFYIIHTYFAEFIIRRENELIVHSCNAIGRKSSLAIHPQLLHQLLNPHHPLIHIVDLHLNFQPILAGE